MQEADVAWRDGRVFTLVYDPGAEVHALAERAFTMFLHENGLNTQAFLAKLDENHATVSQRERILAYERGMDAVVRANPQDLEATIFYARTVVANAPPTDQTFANQLAAAALLQPLFDKHPDHPGLALVAEEARRVKDEVVDVNARHLVLRELELGPVWG